MAPHFNKLENKDPQKFFPCSDPPGNFVGSGGGTANILAAAYKNSGTHLSFTQWLCRQKNLIIHSGGQSRRLPAYSATGKSLLPMPVFRWSVGQNLDQKLLDFQLSYYEKILSKAPSKLCTLIGTGDVMFISSDRFNKLPDADVLLFGIWVEDSTASRHGVFFSRKDKQDELAFVKQKPSLQELRELSGDYYYLMDSGIVLLSAAMTLKLMKKSGWDEEKQQFKNGTPDYYDLYSNMLTSFGTEASQKDPTLGNPVVKLVPLHEGEFYHFGSNSDLVNSTLRLQNRVIDQRLQRSREEDHHPSIFQQNAKISYRFNEENQDIWIENSCISPGWKLSHHHILTGIPENKWNIDLPPGICIDIVPLKNQKLCLRTYGFFDNFRGSINDEVNFLEHILEEWLQTRKIDPQKAGLDPDADVYELPLFPVLEEKEIEAMLNFIIQGNEEKDQQDKWMKTERLSSRDLASQTHFETLYKQRKSYKSRVLPKLAHNHHKSVFYHLDLHRTAIDFNDQDLELPPPLGDKEPVIKQINDSMFRALALKDKNGSVEYEKKAFSILSENMIDTLKNDLQHPTRDLLDDQILWGRSPVRLDFAGGWTDTPPYCIINGGKVVNIAVELNGQPPLQVFARPLEEYKIVLRSIDLGVKEEISGFDQLENYATEMGAFSIPRAALVLAGFGNMFSAKKYDSLEKQLKDFGCGIELSLLAAIPKGSGLGTSSNLAATVLGTLSEFCNLKWDKHEISYRTLILEQMLTTGGGWQDQYGGVFEGVKLLETLPGIRQQPVIKWLPTQLFTSPGTHGMMLLYYTGVTRVAKGILAEIVRSMFLNSAEHLSILEEMQVHAVETFETILGNDYNGLAEKVAYSWQLNQHLDPGTNPPEIQSILNPI
ncbi:MAG: bifunctional fucokinase/fucose-1-phosphate guanylyltransferase, partial [Bacteroidales bacterium]